MNDGSFLEDERSDSECYEDCDKDSSDIEVTLHGSPRSFHEMVRYYTRFGCASDPSFYLSSHCNNQYSKYVKQNSSSLTFAVALAAMIANVAPGAAAHEIPNDVTVQAFFKPSGDRAHLLVRVPLKAMRDLIFPEKASGYLDLERDGPILPDAADPVDFRLHRTLRRRYAAAEAESSGDADLAGVGPVFCGL